jgi:hypothetical protein
LCDSDFLPIPIAVGTTRFDASAANAELHFCISIHHLPSLGHREKIMLVPLLPPFLFLTVLVAVASCTQNQRTYHKPLDRQEGEWRTENKKIIHNNQPIRYPINNLG